MPSFTQKHYEAIAEAVREARRIARDTERWAEQAGERQLEPDEIVTIVAGQLEQRFAADNPGFKPHLWRQAAGVGPTE